MLPWYNNGDRENPLEPLLLKTPCFSHLNQNPITPIFYSNFSSPIFDEHEQLPLNQILHITPPEKPAAYQTQSISDPISKTDPAKHDLTPPQKQKAKADTGSDCQPPRRRSLGSLNQRKRTGKKDRHSKICTAKGFRDRRMRLSLQVARKFFDLQDILGYDKASCTIEWLFSKSKKAIQDLMSKKEIDNSNNDKNIFINFNLSGSDAKSQESLSECEVVSEFHEPSSNSGKESLLGRDKSTKNEKKITKNEKKIMRKAKPNNSREAREKARARARWRTMEKMMIRRVEINSRQFGPQSFSSPGCCDQNVELQKLGFSAEGTIEKLLGNSGFSMPYENCKDLNSNMVGFCGNWEISGTNEERYGCRQVSVRNEGSSMAGNVSPSSVHSDLNFLFFHQ